MIRFISNVSKFSRGQTTHKMQPYDDPLNGVHRPGSVTVRTSWPDQTTSGICLKLEDAEKVFHGKRIHLQSLKLPTSLQLTKIFKINRHRLGITRTLGQTQSCRIQSRRNMDGNPQRGSGDGGHRVREVGTTPGSSPENNPPPQLSRRRDQGCFRGHARSGKKDA